METIELSNALLWAVVVVQGVMILAILRQLEPLAPATSSVGSEVSVGGKAPTLPVVNLNDRTINLGESGHPVIALFLSPGCKVCRHALTALRELTPTHSGNRNIFIIEDEKEAAAKMAAECSLDPEFVIADSAAKSRRAWAGGRLPFLVALDETGVVVGAGSPTSREQLITLIGSGQPPTLRSTGERTQRDMAHESVPE